MNSAAHRIARRKARNRLILTRLGLTVLVCAMFAGWVIADRFGAHYRATYGHLFEEAHHVAR